MKKGMTGPKQVQNPTRPIHQILKLKNNPLWFGASLPSPSTWRSSIYVDQEGNPIHVAVCEGMGGWPS